METIDWKTLIELSEEVPTEAFSGKVYDWLLHVAEITHYGVFVLDQARIFDPELVFYGGKISDYWMKIYALNDRHATLNKSIVFDKNLASISVNRMKKYEFFSFSPDTRDKSEIQKIYRDSGTGEKYYLLHHADGVLYQFNVYRSILNGPFSESEKEMLRCTLPFLTNLVKLRIKICGVDEFQRRPRNFIASNLRKRRVPFFKDLSRREAEVCDLILFGLTTDGVAAELDLSVSTVKTFRTRAYKKLCITSKSELFSMVLNSK